MPRSFVCVLASVLRVSASAPELDVVGMIQLKARSKKSIQEYESQSDAVKAALKSQDLGEEMEAVLEDSISGKEVKHEKIVHEKATALETLPSSWLEKPFKDFTIQCSHNTFLHGSQFSNTVDASVVYTALELGYRCVEIDVYVEGGKLVVHHDSAVGGIMGTTNRVDFKDFVNKIKEWCEQDERKNPTSFKLPLIINIQNGAKSEPVKLKSEISDALGPRIVMPADFTINTPLKKLAIQGQGKQRKVLLRSTKLNAGSEYAKIVAMSKLEGRGALTKSIEVGFTNKNMFISGGQSYMPSDTNLEEIAEAKKANKLVRTYPHKFHTTSVNYKPYYLFKQRAHMICINFQGRCVDDKKTCKKPKRAAPGGDCSCERDVAWGLERVFKDFGYDGYLHLDTLSGQGWEALRGNSNFMYSDEWKGSRRRLPYPPKKDWTPIKA